MKLLLTLFVLCSITAYGQINSKFYLAGAETSEECQKIDQHLRSKPGIWISRTDAHLKLIFIRHEANTKVDQIALQSWLNEISSDFKVSTFENVNQTVKSDESSESILVKDFPKFINTGNKEADEQDYIARRLVWQNTHNTTYQQLIGHKGPITKE